MYQYDRIYELIIGDVKKPKEAVLITNIDTHNGLQLTFEVSKTADTKRTGGNSAVVEIYNLSTDTLKKLQQSKTLGFQLKVGYRETGLKLLVYGQVVQLTTKKQGTDWVTVITAGEGYEELNETKLKKSLPPGVTIEQAIDECRKSMNIDRGIYEGTNKDATAVDGYPLSGSAKEMLNEICEANRIAYRVDRNALYIEDESGINDKNYKKNAFVLNGKTGLLDSPFWTQEDGRKQKKDETRRQSVQFKALLNAEILPGNVVRIDSRFISGWFKITSARYSVTYRNGNWTVDCYASEIKPEDVPKDKEK